MLPEDKEKLYELLDAMDRMHERLTAIRQIQEPLFAIAPVKNRFAFDEAKDIHRSLAKDREEIRRLIDRA